MQINSNERNWELRKTTMLRQTQLSELFQTPIDGPLRGKERNEEQEAKLEKFRGNWPITVWRQSDRLLKNRDVSI